MSYIPAIACFISAGICLYTSKRQKSPQARKIGLFVGLMGVINLTVTIMQ